MSSFLARLSRTATAHCILIAYVFAISACGDARGSAAEPGQEGTEVVRNGETGRWKAGDAWRLAPAARIGSADSDGPDMFGQIVDLAIDSLGRIWVADGHAQEIRVFESGGRHVRSLGSKGGGPNEFAQLAGMDFAPDGTLWVQDPGNTRWTVYDTAGTLVTTHRRPAGVSMVPWPGGFDQEGRLYDVVPVPGKNGAVEHGIVRLGTDLQPSDTLPLPRFEGDFFEVVTGDSRNRNIQRVNVPFTGAQVWRVDPSGLVWTGLTDRYRLYRHAFDGDTSRIVERQQGDVRITDAEMAEMVNAYQWFTDMGGKLDASRIPDAKPPFDGFFFGPDGYMWVVPSQAGDQPARFDIFDPDGAYLGRITGAEGILAVPAPVIRGDLFAAVAQDETGVPSVLVMRIEKPAR